MRNRKIYTIFSAAVADGIGNILDVRDFRNCVVTISSSGTSTFTAYCVGAIGDTAPDFAATQSPTNAWDYLELADLSNSSSPVRGVTGVSSTGADVCNSYEVNVNGVDWLTFNLDWTAGAVTITATLVDNA